MMFVKTDCDVVATKEACKVTVSAPDLSLMPGEELEVDIQLSSEIFIPITIYSTEYQIVDPDESTPPTTPDEDNSTDTPVNSESSGASMNLAVIMSLLLLAIRRNFF
ncbi:hypothetical protein [Vibrio agarivorans]|uniref:GlyGly-CTERM sorting domain-containing protein n=1 Tax=Vibrio agarivorans TaxID=153622 RepID=A0ABT7XXD7_9VIBR|nr:hypothetical protein [Vibrio agarivorans]MDN2480447.1 hypothetical protein [Vibrio agarivorans]